MTLKDADFGFLMFGWLEQTHTLTMGTNRSQARWSFENKKYIYDQCIGYKGRPIHVRLLNHNFNLTDFSRGIQIGNQNRVGRI